MSNAQESGPSAYAEALAREKTRLQDLAMDVPGIRPSFQWDKRAFDAACHILRTDLFGLRSFQKESAEFLECVAVLEAWRDGYKIAPVDLFRKRTPQRINFMGHADWYAYSHWELMNVVSANVLTVALANRAADPEAWCRATFKALGREWLAHTHSPHTDGACAAIADHAQEERNAEIEREVRAPEGELMSELWEIAAGLEKAAAPALELLARADAVLSNEDLRPHLPCPRLEKLWRPGLAVGEVTRAVVAFVYQVHAPDVAMPADVQAEARWVAGGLRWIHAEVTGVGKGAAMLQPAPHPPIQVGAMEAGDPPAQALAKPPGSPGAAVTPPAASAANVKLVGIELTLVETAKNMGARDEKTGRKQPAIAKKAFPAKNPDNYKVYFSQLKKRGILGGTRRGPASVTWVVQKSEYTD